MEELDKILAAMTKRYNLSISKLEMMLKSKGICLTNGVEYGKHLRRVLLESKKLKVPINSTRPYKYARKCLIKLH